MLNKVICAIDKYGMFDNTEDVTVAISGGADSVCLLLALCELKEKYRINLAALHINHMLRGAESDRDEDFVKALCKQLQIPLTVRREDVKSVAEEQGKGIELAAREVRYKIFKEAAKGVVATAHSADDNLETVLFNMARGSGLKGICGIPPKRDIFVRPLIFCSRAEIEAYLKAKGHTFVTDSSNLTDDYTRNFLRHNAVPLLERVNPNVRQTVAAMSSSLREDDDFLFSTAKKIYALCLRGDHLDAGLLRLQHPSVTKRVIALYLEEQFQIKTDALHLENCKTVLEHGGRTGLVRNMSAICRGERFFISSEEDMKPKTVFKVDTREINLINFPKINNLFLKNAIDCDKINGSLTVRSRLPSDEIRLCGRNCTKSLKKLFNELKTPNELRDVIPVAADESGVVWIYGVGVSERVKIDSATERAVEFVVTRINKS